MPCIRRWQVDSSANAAGWTAFEMHFSKMCILFEIMAATFLIHERHGREGTRNRWQRSRNTQFNKWTCSSRTQCTHTCVAVTRQVGTKNSTKYISRTNGHIKKKHTHTEKNGIETTQRHMLHRLAPLNYDSTTCNLIPSMHECNLSAESICKNPRRIEQVNVTLAMHRFFCLQRLWLIKWQEYRSPWCRIRFLLLCKSAHSGIGLFLYWHNIPISTQWNSKDWKKCTPGE